MSPVSTSAKARPAYWALHGVFALALVALAGCASSPSQSDPSEADYQRYWGCAYAAAMGHAPDADLPARQAAMRAQAECYPSYLAYRDAKIRYVRSVVPESDRHMAITLASEAALQRRKAITQRLTELVADAR
jgi:hypothetical protein